MHIITTKTYKNKYIHVSKMSKRPGPRARDADVGRARGAEHAGEELLLISNSNSIIITIIISSSRSSSSSSSSVTCICCIMFYSP